MAKRSDFNVITNYCAVFDNGGRMYFAWSLMLCFRINHHCADFGLGNLVAINHGMAIKLENLPALLGLLHMQFQTVTGNDWLAETNFINRHEINQFALALRMQPWR